VKTTFRIVTRSAAGIIKFVLVLAILTATLVLSGCGDFDSDCGGDFWFLQDGTLNLVFPLRMTVTFQVSPIWKGFIFSL
jgi:hypothetical protein